MFAEVEGIIRRQINVRTNLPCVLFVFLWILLSLVNLVDQS